MKTFKEWAWIPTAAKVAWDTSKYVVPQLIKRVNPATVGVPIQTGKTLGDKLRDGVKAAANKIKGDLFFTALFTPAKIAFPTAIPIEPPMNLKS